MLLDKNNFDSLVKRKTKVIKCDGFEVKIQALLIQDQIEIEKLNAKDNKEDNELVFLMLKLSCINDSGELILDDNNVKKLPSNIALHIFSECLKINGLSNDELEARAKNS